MRAVVVDHDLVTPFGRGAAAAWSALSDGACAIAPLQRFPWRRTPDPAAALVPGLEHDGRTSLCMQMLDPLLRDVAPRVPCGAGVVLATITGEVDLLERHVLDGTGAVGDSRLTDLLAKVQDRLGTGGEGWVVSAACASATAAIAQAAAVIEDGAADAVLVVACEAVTEFVFSGFASLGALSASRAAPFDRRRDGLSLGEAAGCMLLVSEERAEREGRRPLAAVTGWGASNDAHHMTGPSAQGTGLRRAIGRALRMADVAPAEIRAVSAHGTGTVFNDSMEMAAFRGALGDAPVPTFSVKGALGHSMGAAGLVEAILLVHALGERAVPGTVGCRDVDDAARGWVAPHARAIRPGPVLSTNSGFGGINAALVLEPADPGVAA